MNDNAKQNTDTTVWRSISPDGRESKIFITRREGLGIECSGYAIVSPVERWHEMGKIFFGCNPTISKWRYKLAMWLLKSNKPINWKE